MNHDGAGFGARLHAYRVSVRLSQEELAERSGVSVRTISNLERGRARWPYPDTVRRLADALRLPAEARAEFAAAAGRRLAGHGPGALAGELAIEPGPGLRELHERILAGDACILPASPTAGAAQPMPADATIPRQLPAAVRSFVGRRAEFSMLCSLAEQAAERVEAGGVVISAIDGMAGIGKTALAVRAAHQLAGKFLDGQLFIDMHGYTQGREPRPAGEALELCLRTLGVSPRQVPRDTEERAALFRQRLAGTRTLIVLDNAVDETQVRPLLPGSAGCLVLITSRRRLKGLDDAQVLTLDVLPKVDAMALVRAAAGPGRVRGDDPVLAEIAGLCGLLPLALRIAAALLRHRPVWTTEHLVELLRDQRHRISALSDGERHLGAVFDLSYKSLPGAHQRLFRGYDGRLSIVWRSIMVIRRIRVIPLVISLLAVCVFAGVSLATAGPASALPVVTVCLTNAPGYCADVKDSVNQTNQPVWLYSPLSRNLRQVRW